MMFDINGGKLYTITNGRGGNDNSRVPSTRPLRAVLRQGYPDGCGQRCAQGLQRIRSEEHTSELQSLRHIVCRLLLEKKTDDDSVLRAGRRGAGGQGSGGDGGGG